MLLILRRIWPYLAIVAGLAAAYFWIDHRGYARGKADVEARHAKAAARMVAAADRIRTATDRLAGQAATARTEQVTTERTIYRDAIKIVDRPVYRSICVDADGVQLLDRARDSANRGLTGESAGAAADASPDTAQR
ncbi:hypothetical protein ACFSGX_15160 [Sphingomonas arantia]|uniref:Uncharacterized protein n=1 Tax=Sphingomonas arantia TaxID=1460676 RepID=A0ABW4U2Y4_9SPHN